MNQKTIYALIASIVGVGIAMALGLLLLIQYGGNNCDQPPAMTCDCFCCDMFGLRGYEACAKFGLYAGITIGLILVLLILSVILRNRE